MATPVCVTCVWEKENGRKVDTSQSKSAWGREIGVSEMSIRRHLSHPAVTSSPVSESSSTNPDGSQDHVRFSDHAWGQEEIEAFLLSTGTDPDTVTYGFGWTSNPTGGFWNKLNNVRERVVADDGNPAWPVVQPAPPVTVQMSQPVVTLTPRQHGNTLSLKCADHQIGFRALPDGTFEEFHDWSAMNVFIEVCRLEQPETIIILGDFLDLPSQGKYAQEAGFARTTQMAIDDGHKFLALLRAAAPNATIVIVEGNHDKRMQNFIEANALAAFGLKRANLPDEWPTLSLPFLLRLDELDIVYMDAYPAAVWWDDEGTRNIHGTRANSKGSTMSQYIHELPHINTWAGHTHRVEIIYRSVIGAYGKAIESYSANPGCQCKTDGTVPSVHGAIHSDGSSARLVEDWQQGFGSLLSGPDGSWPQVYRIKNGKTLYEGRIIG